MSVGTISGLTVMPSHRAAQAAWRAVQATAYAPKHVPAALLKRDAEFAPSGTRGGGPPV
ncbi:MAG TPA: hypothetical protein VHV82_03195 [Sporichthyaceae bacterium]|jgi:hypothetical protein|nr:hypothetical protein [Sporichthyaceae bacterium]